MINEISSTVTPPLSQSTFAPQAPSLASDFDTFLKMLTAQAKYQDPLNPVDSTEYASQLAQFSAVEQAVRTNETLQLIVGQLGGSDISSLASWVGMEARALSPAYFDGTSPISISPNPAAVADRVELVVYDEQGVEVQRNVIPVSAEQLEWTGLDDDGFPLPEGTYSFAVESFAEDELILAEQAEVYSRVTEAQVLNGDIILILEGGQAILSSSVTGLRDP